MKKLSVILGSIAIATLSLGGLTFALTNHPQYKEAKAGGYDEDVSRYTGYFEKVTDPSHIQDGDKLLLVANSNTCFQYLVGASMHFWLTTYGGEFDIYSDDLIYLNNNKAELITFEKSGDSFYLHLEHYIDNTTAGEGKAKSGYIVHEAYNDHDVTAFGDLYIRGKKDQPSTNASLWNLEYVDNNMRLTTNEGDDARLMTWRGSSGYNWSTLWCTPHLEWTSNINLYRPVTKISPEEVISNLETTDYGLTDVLRTNGLGIYFEKPAVIEGSVNLHYVYVHNHPRFFNIDTTINYETAGTKTREFTYIPNGATYSFTINVIDAQIYHFSRISDDEIDYRGTYLAIAEQSNKAYNTGEETYNQSDNGSAIDLGSGLNTSNHTLTTSNVDLYRYHTWINRSSAYNYAAFNIALDARFYESLSLNRYYMSQYADNADFGYNTYNVDEGGFNPYIAILNYTDFVTISHGALVINNLTLKYNKVQGRFGLTSEGDSGIWETARLYRLDLNEKIVAEADHYRTQKFDDIFRDGICQMDGSTDSTTIYNYWEGLSTQYFETCSPDAQYYLAHLIYTHNAHNKDTNESMVDCYDYVRSKYNSETAPLFDFMFRSDVGTYQPTGAQEAAKISHLVNDFVTAPVLIVVAMGLLLGASAIFFYKKLKIKNK